MKKKPVITALLALLILVLGVQLAVRFWPRHTDSLDRLYAVYSRTDGLHAALLRGKGVHCGPACTDSVYVDMLMLSAPDSAVWQNLMDDFGIAAPHPLMRQRLSCGDDIVTVAPYCPPADSAACCMRVVSHLSRSVAIVSAATDDDLAAVRHTKMQENIDLTI